MISFNKGQEPHQFWLLLIMDFKVEVVEPLQELNGQQQKPGE
jgi:hypothetical protein